MQSLVAATCLLSASSSFASETNLYHTNRVFKPIDCTISGVKTAYKIHTMAGRLTSVVGPTNIVVHTNNTFAREYEAVAWGYESANAAWTSVVANFSTHYQTYPTSTYDNVGWIKGTREAYGTWGGFLWLMQNQVDFQTSPTNIWISPMGVTCRISRVFVRSIGDYAPMQNVVDVGPTNWAVITNFLGSGTTEEKVYKGDYSAYYELLAVTITPRDKVGCPRCLSTITYNLTNSSIPGGVTWSLKPAGLSGGATMSSAGGSATVNPGTLGTNYKIRATANLDTNCFDEVQLTFCLPGPITQVGNFYDDTSTGSYKTIYHQFSPSPVGEVSANHFCFVQKLKGFVHGGDGSTNDVQMYFPMQFYPCSFPDWVIDSDDNDPSYWSTPSNHTFHLDAGNNVYYVRDRPGPAEPGNLGSVFNLSFEIGIYCGKEVPISGASSQPAVGTPFETASWDYQVTVTTNGTFTHP